MKSTVKCIHCFVMHSLQNPPLCSSTIRVSFALEGEGGIVVFEPIYSTLHPVLPVNMTSGIWSCGLSRKRSLLCQNRKRGGWGLPSCCSLQSLSRLWVASAPSFSISSCSPLLSLPLDSTAASPPLEWSAILEEPHYSQGKSAPTAINYQNRTCTSASSWSLHLKISHPAQRRGGGYSPCFFAEWGHI